MEILLKDTLTGEKRKFEPLVKGQVSMYNCGPTVYDFAHIGNLRSYVFADILRRMFEWNGYRVNQVINITDIGHLASDADSGEDKMTKALKREGKPLTLEAMREVAEFYFGKFKEDLAALNIEIPTHFPFASEHIAEDIEIVQKLQEKEFTYTISDGIYFDTEKFPNYGKLGNVSKMTFDTEKSRIGENMEKKNPRDFALWKFSDTSIGYESPFGKGFPGWHIECSAMSRTYLGQPFDIHTGGIDHIPVHHNNEIAQSEAAFGTPLANYWMHNAFLTIQEGRMGKSQGNFITLNSLKEEGIDPLALRYFFLTAHYSSQQDFTWEALKAAQTAWRRLKGLVEMGTIPAKMVPISRELGYREKFTQFISDDLNIPKALALMWEIAKDEKLDPSEKSALILEFDKVLGLRLDEKENMEIPEEVKQLVKEREKARREKNWQRSDELRAVIEDKGFLLKDTTSGTSLDKK